MRLLISLCITLLLSPPAASASDLLWSNGAKDIAASPTAPCTLLVQGDGELPSSWNLIWVGRADTGPAVRFERLSSEGATADACSLTYGPRLREGAYSDTSRHCDGLLSGRATVARYLVRVGRGARAKILLAFPSGEGRDLREVTINGGVATRYQAALFGISTARHRDRLTLAAEGLSLDRVVSARYVPAAGGAPLYLSIGSQSPDSITLVVRKPDGLRAGHVEVTDDEGRTSVVPVAGEGPVDPSFAYPSHLIVRFRSGSVAMPPGRVAADLSECNFAQGALRDSLNALGVQRLTRLLPWFTSEDIHTTNDLGEPVVLEDLTNLYVLDLPIDADVLQTSDRANRLSGILYSSGDPFALGLATLTPNDPQFPDQWYHQAFPSAPTCGQMTFPGTTLRTEEAWNHTTGSPSVKIAILDTGIAPDHEDLSPRVELGPTFVESTYSSDDDAGNRHGTAVAGIAAGTGNNGLGVAGVAWGATPVAIKVLNANGGGQPSSITQGISWADDQGIPILNLSIAVPADSFDATTFAAMSDVCLNAFNKGRIVIAGAGNPFSTTIGQLDVYPVGFLQRVVGVGAVLPDASRWDDELLNPDFCFIFQGHCRQSNPGTVFNPIVDFEAPGGRFILSTSHEPNLYYDLGSCNTANLTGTGFGGTSASAPQVAGIAALLKSLRPELTGEDILHILEVSAVSIHSPPGESWDPEHGYGLVRAGPAMDEVSADKVVAHWGVGNSYPDAIGTLGPTDSTEVTVTFIGHPDLPTDIYETTCIRYRMAGAAFYPFTFTSPPRFWSRSSGTLGWRDTSVIDYGYEVNWGRMFPIGDGSSAAAFETYVYRVLDNTNPDTTLAWFPAEPAKARIAFTAIGVTGTVGLEESGGSRLGVSVVPNPVRMGAMFELSLSGPGELRVDVVDVAGRRVAEFERGTILVGTKSIAWDGRGNDGRRCAPGVYFVRVMLDREVESRRFVLLN